MATRDLSPNAAPPPTSVNVQRASFRRRLVLSITPAVILALAALALIAWGAVRIALQRSAIDVLTAEAEEVVAELRLTPDSLHATGHSWAEPHHRLAIPRVDPVFVQIFAPRNRLLRQSTNIDSLSGTYPDRLLAAQTPYDWIPSLRTITVDDRRLYYFVRPIRDAQGTRRGYIQVARDTPDHRAFVHTFGFSLLGLWLFLSAGFIGLVAWTATRVLRPLQQITTDARTISSDHLETRVTVPDAADRETALLAQALNGLLERIEQYVEALRSFTSHAAHELQTPLAVLQGHIEISLRKERDADSYRSTLRLLDRKMKDLTDIVRALLTLTRLEHDPTPDARLVDLGALVRDEARTFEAAAEDSNLALHIDTQTPTPVNGHPNLLRDAARNLVENAIKYTPNGRVEVRVARRSDQVVFECADTGIGIADDELPHIGSRFYRSDRANQTHAAGSGLGLSIVRRIVARHNGTLSVETEVGEGTTVRITFPAPADVPDAR